MVAASAPDLLGEVRLRPMTFEEWVALDGDETGELVDGYLVEGEMASFVHEILVAYLVRVLGAWAASRGALVFASGAKYEVSPRRGRMPDISVFLGATRPGRGAVSAKPPDIAVEIISSAPRDVRRDRIDKLREYAAFGVRYYWLVDPELRALQIHELDAEGRYAHVIDTEEGTVTTVPGCPGLSIDVDAMWSEIDRLDEPSRE